jgi:Raf kinase inhibitor-like YbhB/YbcL family protein
MAVVVALVLLPYTLSLSKEVRTMHQMKLTSTAFQDNGPIPKEHTCDGKDTNPPLAFGNVPSEAKSLAMIADDPDAPVGTWVHWVMWNIDPGVKSIEENSVPAGATQGLNDFKKNKYGGPCPPSGTHRYFFKLYAVDTMLNISPKSTKADLEKAMAGHIVGQGQLVGLYKRR